MMTAEEKKLRRRLKALTSVVMKAIAAIDAEMKGPSTPERGKRIAAIMNALEMENDKTRYFYLGIEYRTDKKRLT